MNKSKLNYWILSYITCYCLATFIQLFKLCKICSKIKDEVNHLING